MKQSTAGFAVIEPSQPMKKNQIYLPTLNGIQAFAAILVIVCHMDEWIYRFGIETTDYYRKGIGAYAAVMFFALSGFLITYLLIRKQEKYGAISYGRLYTRSILGIWPLCYTFLIAGKILVVNASSQFWHTRNIYATLSVYILMAPKVVHNFAYRSVMRNPFWIDSKKTKVFA